MRRRVVVTGRGVLAPNGNSIETFWEALINGRSGIGPLTRIDSDDPKQAAGEVKGFDPLLCLSPKEVRRTDRTVQFAVEVATQAINESGLDMDSIEPGRTCVIFGTAMGGIATLEREHAVLLEKGPERVSPFLIPMSLADMSAGMISIKHGIRGANHATVSACASGSQAIGEAMRKIQHGEVDVVVAGGSEAAITPLCLAGFKRARVLARPDGEPGAACRPFDADRSGFVLGEGAGAVVLEEYEHAKRRGAEIFSELLGYGLASDAYHMTDMHPAGEGSARAVRSALEDAGLTAAAVSYVNAHGTSTPMGDAVESMALHEALGSHAHDVAVSSTKSMTGHLLGAAGAVELLACIEAIRSGWIPPTINYHTPDPRCDLDYVPNEARQTTVRIALSNSFGFGGHNVVLIVGPAP